MCNCYSKTQEEKTEVILNSKKPDPKRYLKKIVKIQAFVRGHLTRKKYFRTLLQLYNDKVLENLHKYAYNYHLRRGKRLNNYAYNFQKDSEDPQFGQRQFRPATQIPNGGMYKGEW